MGHLTPRSPRSAGVQWGWGEWGRQAPQRGGVAKMLLPHQKKKKKLETETLQREGDIRKKRPREWACLPGLDTSWCGRSQKWVVLRR